MTGVDQFYREGERCYRTQRGRYSNPYRPGTHEHNQFERGWVQAQKRDGVF